MLNKIAYFSISFLFTMGITLMSIVIENKWLEYGIIGLILLLSSMIGFPLLLKFFNKTLKDSLKLD